MKFKNSSKIIFTFLAMACVLMAFACNNNKSKIQSKDAITTNTTANSTNPASEQKPPTMTDVPVGNAQTPTEAYRMLFAAVKSQESSKIRSMLSSGSMGLAQMASGQQKKPLEEIIKNGLTETTFAEDYPQMRDERIKGNSGAVEVWNAKRKQWDDVPFIYENGGWKAAFGDAMSGKWELPSKSQGTIERENANAANPNAMIPMNPMGNSNTNGKFRNKGRIPRPGNQ